MFTPGLTKEELRKEWQDFRKEYKKQLDAINAAEEQAKQAEQERRIQVLQNYLHRKQPLFGERLPSWDDFCRTTTVYNPDILPDELLTPYRKASQALQRAYEELESAKYKILKTLSAEELEKCMAVTPAGERKLAEWYPDQKK